VNSLHVLRTKCLVGISMVLDGFLSRFGRRVDAMPQAALDGSKRCCTHDEMHSDAVV
jgi:hypothetical protein